MGTPLLQISQLHAGYGKAEVLHGLNLHAERGSVITVIGPNGAGKSTLLNSLMGLLPSVGRIEFNGESIDTLTLEERVMLGIALVPEKRELFGSMSVQDNLILGGFRPMRLGQRLWRSRMDEVFDLFPRLRERRAQLAGTLSGGERQMLAVGRALMSNPSLLMLDEPSLGLAPLIVRDIFSIIQTLRTTGVTIVLVEQNFRFAAPLADRHYVMEHGRIVATVHKDELASKTAMLNEYLGV